MDKMHRMHTVQYILRMDRKGTNIIMDYNTIMDLDNMTIADAELAYVKNNLALIINDGRVINLEER